MKPISTIAVIFFGLFALLHVTRLIVGFQVVIGSFTVPVWASIAGAIVFAYLSYAMWKEVKGR
jgi:hypothetical protein